MSRSVIVDVEVALLWLASLVVDATLWLCLMLISLCCVLMLHCLLSDVAVAVCCHCCFCCSLLLVVEVKDEDLLVNRSLCTVVAEAKMLQFLSFEIADDRCKII